jgi:hypothetical protein
MCVSERERERVKKEEIALTITSLSLAGYNNIASYLFDDDIITQFGSTIRYNSVLQSSFNHWMENKNPMID